MTAQLEWHRVNDCEWQAKAPTGYYSIIEQSRPGNPGNQSIFHDVGYVDTDKAKLARLGGSFSFLEARKFAEAHHTNSRS